MGGTGDRACRDQTEGLTLEKTTIGADESAAEEQRMMAGNIGAGLTAS